MFNERPAPLRTSWHQALRTWPFLLTLLLVPAVIGAANFTDWCAPQARLRYGVIVMKRVEEIRPVRRDSPMRYLNISDDETREVDSAAAEYTGTEWINIGTVVTGCPCEDGDGCTDQVWVQTRKEQGAIGLPLSKVDWHWQIGYVQRCWLRHEELLEQRARVPRTAEYKAFQEAVDQQIEFLSPCGLDKKALAESAYKVLPSCLRESR